MTADREASAAGIADSSGTIPGTVPGAGAGPSDRPGKSLFEAILESGLSDEQTHIVHRGQRVFAILNRYPYSTGHLLILPYRAVPEIENLDADERREMWDTVHDAVTAVKAAFSPTESTSEPIWARAPVPACTTTYTSMCCPAGAPTPTS